MDVSKLSKFFEVELVFYYFTTGHHQTFLTFEDKSTKRRQVKKIDCNQQTYLTFEDKSTKRRQVKKIDCNQQTNLTFEDKSTKRRQVKKIVWNQSFLKRRQLTNL